ncbi:MAG TPA: adenylate/guanylate cyclase domain-containing protein [Firmicutes bacterium]|nr:adenylate/guanylate cyclase domain-containing protein [Bacillota bacterium]
MVSTRCHMVPGPFHTISGRRHIVRGGVVLILPRSRFWAFLVICLVVIAGYMGGAFERLELWSYDVRVRLAGEMPVEEAPVALVLADERSLESLGQWPWPRTLHARLVSILSGAGARVVAFDVVFAEPDSKSPQGDLALAHAIRQAGNVVLATPAADKGMTRRSRVFETDRMIRPVTALVQSARVLGHVVAVPDPDGVLRRLPAAVVAGDGAYFGLAVEAARLYLARGQDADQSVGDPDADRPGKEPNAVQVGGIMRFMPGRFLDFGGLRESKRSRAPLDGTSSILINYRLRGAIKTFSYIDVIAGSVHPREFAGKAVIVGVAAPGLGDSYATPLSTHGELVSGAEINSLLAATLISGYTVRRAGLPYVILGIILLGILSAFLMGRNARGSSNGRSLAPGRSLPLAGMVGATILGAYVLFLHGVWLDVMPLVGVIVLSYVIDMGLTIRDEVRQREQIRATFERYLAPEAVRGILAQPSLARLGGTRRAITVMFADIRGFTSFARDRDPVEVCEVLNDYLSIMGQAVFEEGGAIDKFTGDGVMALFGALVEIEDREQHAVRAAFKIMQRVKGLQHGLAVGIGIASGEAVVGNIGMPTRMDYTAIGPPVNLASKLEDLAGPQVVLVDGPTRASLSGIATRPFGEIRLPHAGQPVEAFEAIWTPEVLEP